MDSESDIVKSYCFVEELASIASCTSRISRSIPGQVRRTFGPSVDPRAAKSALIAGVSVSLSLGRTGEPRYYCIILRPTIGASAIIEPTHHTRTSPSVSLLRIGVS